MNAFDPSAGINIGGAMQAGMESRNAMLDMQRARDAQAFMQQNGAAIMAGDKNAMAQLAGFDPKLAMGLMGDRSSMDNDSRRTDIASRSADASIAASQASISDSAARLKLAQEQGSREMEVFAQGASTRELAETTAHLQTILLQGKQAMADPVKWSEFVKSNEIDDDIPIERAEEELMRISGALGVKPETATVGRDSRLVDTGTGEILLDAAPEAAKPMSPAGKLAHDIDKGFVDGGTNKVRVKDESTLRKEWNGLTTDFSTIGDAYTKVTQAANGNDGVADVALIFGYMKMLDPDSVVREGEFATAEQTNGAAGQFINLYNKLINGQRLTPIQRQNFQKQAQGIFETSAGTYRKKRELYRSIATESGLDPERSVPDLDVFDRAVPAANPDDLSSILDRYR